MPGPRVPRPPRPTRRELLGVGAAMAAGIVAGRPGTARADPPVPAAMPTRPFGATGAKTSVFGLGCFPLGSLPEDDDAIAVVLRALDLGVTYVDTAPSYGRGKSESRVGAALRARPDAVVFVATKTHTRTAADARRDLEGSLRRIDRTPLDLVQVHAVKDEADLAQVLAPGGPLEALEKAREEGLVRHVGVTGHADPAVMRKAVETGRFASLLCPLNCVDPHHLSFVRGTLPAAVAQGVGRVAMKVFASGGLVDRGIDPEACLRYTFGLDVATAIVGCRFVREVETAARVACEARRLAPEEEAELLRQTVPHRGREVEWYKRT